jgi:RNA polymerase sigma factor (sigma-70 family)
MDDEALREHVSQAQRGDAAALDRVVRAIQDDVFALAARILGHPDDAREACQEILIRVVTKLGQFRGESRFGTWVYRVASNALLDFRAALRMREQKFETTGEQLDEALAASDAPAAGGDPEHDAMVNEVKLVCTQGMLLCLDRAHRLAYVLGEILDFSSEDAAAILEIGEDAFRQRLSRARKSMEAFMHARCGLANPATRCRCAKLAPVAASRGFIDPSRPVLTSLPVRKVDAIKIEVEQLRSAAEVFRGLPAYASPEDFATALRASLERAIGGDRLQ